MKRIIIFCVIIITLILPVEAKVLEGSVTYEANKAWETAMSYAEKKLPQEIIDSHLVDPDYEENQVAIKYKISQLGKKLITYYSDGTYTIVELNNYPRGYAYSYDPNGNLFRAMRWVDTSSGKIVYYYNTSNVMTAVNYEYKPNQAYIFDAKTGKLKSHWVNNKGYYTNGKVVEILN